MNLLIQLYCINNTRHMYHITYIKNINKLIYSFIEHAQYKYMITMIHPYLYNINDKFYLENDCILFCKNYKNFLHNSYTYLIYNGCLYFYLYLETEYDRSLMCSFQIYRYNSTYNDTTYHENEIIGEIFTH
jgi:hypothetical protein